MPNQTDHKQFLTAARGKIMLGAQHLGNARGIRVNDSIRNQPAKVIGSVRTVALVPVDSDCSVTVDLFFVKDETVARNMHQTEHGEILMTEPVDIHCLDNISNRVVFTVKGCMPAAKSFDVTQGGIAMRNVTFDAILSREATQ